MATQARKTKPMERISITISVFKQLLNDLCDEREI